MFTVITWNVNGAKSSKLELDNLLSTRCPDVVCLQEVKCKDPCWTFENYNVIWNASTKRSSYAGTAVLVNTKHNIVNVVCDPISCCSDEGRVIGITLCNKIKIVCVYVPNSGVDRKEPLKRLSFRTNQWDPEFCRFVNEFNPMIVCGDLNVAINDDDVHNPKSLRKKAGFTKEERDSFNAHFGKTFTDVYKHVQETPEFTFWGSYKGLKEANKGWRLDYQLCNSAVTPKRAIVHKNDYHSSDHVPLEVVYSL